MVNMDHFALDEQTYKTATKRGTIGAVHAASVPLEDIPLDFFVTVSISVKGLSAILSSKPS